MKTAITKDEQGFFQCTGMSMFGYLTEHELRVDIQKRIQKQDARQKRDARRKDDQNKGAN
jgi:hypothetical protein